MDHGCIPIMPTDDEFNSTVLATAQAVVKSFMAKRNQKEDSSGLKGMCLIDLPLDKEPLKSYRKSRFNAETKLLYRPDIVEGMKRVILDPKNELYGTMIKGAQGIGKSHSLVTLVSHLRSLAHIVTFIPNCQDFKDTDDYMQAVFRSMDVDPASFGIQLYQWNNRRARFFVTCVIKAMAEANEGLEEDKQLRWFMVFDQVNRIFARPSQKGAKDVGSLDEPFAFMEKFCGDKNVHSVIAASANNALSYKPNHEGFQEYLHPLKMSMEEVEFWQSGSEMFQSFNGTKRKEMEEATGLCPLQVTEYLKKGAEIYLKDAVNLVCGDTQKLLREQTDDKDKLSIAKNAICCLLSIPIELRGDEAYDKKYSVLASGKLLPLFPAVEIAYRDLFWNELMDYMEKEEANLLRTCRNSSVTNDVRGRLFELIVISRLVKKKVLSKTKENAELVVLPQTVDRGMRFGTQKLPSPDEMDSNTLFIPKNPNFPAIDLILKEGKIVWGIQVHVADHENVLPKFREMCMEKGWFSHFDDVKLVYLSPSAEVTNLLGSGCIPTAGPRPKRRRRAKQVPPTIEVSGDCIKDPGWECLKDIQWPSTDAMDVEN